MGQETAIVIFKENSIRRTWYEDAWWFSIVDVCAILTDSHDANAYWRKLKQRLNEVRATRDILSRVEITRSRRKITDN